MDLAGMMEEVNEALHELSEAGNPLMTLSLPAPRHATAAGMAKDGEMVDLGESSTAAAGAKAKFPGPFSPVKKDSDGTGGYQVYINHYNDLESTTYAVDCGGDLNAGNTQSYSEAEVPDLTACSLKCSNCTACQGYIDMLEDRQCHFMAELDLTRIAPGSGHTTEDYKRYFNKVKTYHNCNAGNWSQAEAPGGGCEICEEGKFSHKGASACTQCIPGTYHNLTMQTECLM